MKKVDYRGNKYNKKGIKVDSELRVNHNQWSTDFFDLYTADGTEIDPFDRVEEQKKAEHHAEMVELMRRILPVILGADNFKVYYLVTIKKLPYAPVANLLGITEQTARKRNERNRAKIEQLAIDFKMIDNLQNELDGVSFDLEKELFDDKQEDFEFDFEQSEREYYENQQKIEKELGI